MKQTLHWRLVWPNYVSQCCVHRVSLTVTKHLDFLPLSIRPLWLQGLYLRTLFLGSKCWILARHNHPMGDLVPKGNSYDRWKCYPGRSSLIPIRSALRPRTSWTYSFILPYLSEMMFIDISLDWVLSQRRLWHSPQASVNTLPHVSLFTKDDDSAKTVTAQCRFWQKCLGIFIPLPPAVLIGFTHEANIALEAGLVKFCF